MSVPFVGQLNVKNLLHAPNQLRIADRKEDLHAMTQVSPHQVGASEINLLRTPVSEIVDPAMFQKPAHDACDSDILTESIDRRSQATKSSYEQVYPYTRFLGPIEQPDHLWIFESVH